MRHSRNSAYQVSVTVYKIRYVHNITEYSTTNSKVSQYSRWVISFETGSSHLGDHFQIA